jgi:hypothetical protein
MKTSVKRLFISFLSFILILNQIIFAQKISAAVPLDTASTWARTSITEAVGKGFVPYDLQDSYTNVISRQEFCRLAVKWLEYATGNHINTVLTNNGLSRNPNAFTDTSDSDILAAYALGITSGVGNNRFNPYGNINREQAATMIMNTVRALGVNVSNPPRSGFSDISTASSWAQSGISFVHAYGIMQGTGNNNFSPSTLYTREQSIITFNNIKHRDLFGSVQDFSGDITKLLALGGKAKYSDLDNSILLCPAETQSYGNAFYPKELPNNFTVTYDFKISGSGTGADGIVCVFFAKKEINPAVGGYLNFSNGYGIELDTHRNIIGDYAAEDRILTNGTKLEKPDPDKPHIALIHEKPLNHLLYREDERVKSNTWHTVVIRVQDNRITASIDGDTLIDYTGIINRSNRHMYFTATTGSFTNNHYIRNVILQYRE